MRLLREDCSKDENHRSGTCHAEERKDALARETDEEDWLPDK
jgi:hypothetical protein